MHNYNRAYSCNYVLRKEETCIKRLGPRNKEAENHNFEVYTLVAAIITDKTNFCD